VWCFKYATSDITRRRERGERLPPDSWLLTPRFLICP
jgi:hypothetical protein